MDTLRGRLCLVVTAIAIAAAVLPQVAESQDISKALKRRIEKLDRVIEGFADKFNATGDMRKFEALVKRLDQRGGYIAEAEKRHGAKHPEVVALMASQAKMEKAYISECEAMLLKTLADAQPPVDVYRGGDRDEVAETVTTAWQAAHPDDEILDLRFPEATWTNKKVWEYDAGRDAFEFVDRSTLWVRVIVKYTDKLAIAYTAYATKDNVAKTLGASVYTKRGHVWDVLLVSSVAL